MSYPGQPERRLTHAVFMVQTYRVGQALAERSDAEEMGCVVTFVAQQDRRCMSAFSFTLDDYSADFLTGAV